MNIQNDSRPGRLQGPAGQRCLHHHHPLRAVALASATMLGLATAQAFEFQTGNDDLSVRWDNTVKGSVKYRLEDADPALNNSFRQVPTGAPPPAPATFSFPQALNFNAGNQNFQKKGFVSERLDVLSEFDAIWRKDFGLRLSAAAWGDAEYSRSTKATDAFVGQTPIDEFPSGTKKIAGHKVEMLDWFVFGGTRFDNGMKLTGRLGSHALQYGESLFFGDNGIARAQGPVDIDKLLASPNAQFKEIIRPVPQLSAQLQFSPTLSIGGYYQFRWEEDRLPPAGSYFSSANIPWGSQQPEFANIPSGPIAGNYALTPGGDVKPKNSGQFGVQLKWRYEETDFGFYAAKFHDKDGQLYGRLNPGGTPNPFGQLPGQWYYVFPEDVKTVGASVSHSIGDFNLAAEASIRDDMPLRSTNMLYPGQILTPGGLVTVPQPQYATGRTAHFNFSWLASLGPNFLARESSFLGEIAWNRVLHKDDPDGELDGGRTRDATAIRMIFSPSYRQALPGLDLSVPIGVGYTIDGNSSVTAWGARHTGDFSLGLEGNYLATWQFALNYTHYIGKAVPFVDYSPILAGGSPIFGLGNPLADRDYISLTLRRTF